jgi:hypothetical protein
VITRAGDRSVLVVGATAVSSMFDAAEGRRPGLPSSSKGVYRVSLPENARHVH